MKAKYLPTVLTPAYLIIFIAALCIFMASTPLAMAGTKTSVTGTVNWTTAASWNPSGVPASGDDIIVPSGSTVTLDGGNQTYPATGTFKSLSVTGALYMDNTNSNSVRTLNVSGNVMINSGGLIASRSTTNTLNQIFNIGGNLTNNGTFTTLTNSDAINVSINGTVAQSIDGSTATVFNNLTISNTTAVVTANVNFSIRSGATMTVSANTTFNSGTQIISGAGTFTLASGGTLGIGSTTGIATSGATGNIQTSTRNFNTAANYIYNGTANQVTGNGLVTASNVTINTASPSISVTSSSAVFSVSNNLTVTQGNLVLAATNGDYTFKNVIVSSNGTLTHSVLWDTPPNRKIGITGNLDVTGIFNPTYRSHVNMNGAGAKTIRTGENPASTLSILTFNDGTFSANGTLKTNQEVWAMFGSAGSFSTAGNNVTFAAMNNNMGSVNVNGGSLTVYGSCEIGYGGTTGSINVSSGTFNVNGSLIINTTGTFTCTNSPTINITGDWTKNGTYTKANETVNFNGNGNQSIGGSLGTSFGNLAFSGSGVKTVPPGTLVAGNLSISGATASLNNGITVSVNSLKLGGINQPAGTWGSTNSSATYKNNTYFASTTGMLNVTIGAALPTAVFSGLTASQNICPGTSTLSLGGVVSAGSVYPANGETVGITINGITQNATIMGGVGAFSLNFNTSVLPASETAYTIIYSYGGGIYLSAATNNSETSILVHVPFASVTAQTNISCYDGTDGSISISASGGIPPYSYSVDNGTAWSSSPTNPYRYGGLKANTPYQIRVKDSTGCTSPEILP